MSRRLDIKAILADPAQRRKLFVRAIMTMQHMEGINTTQEQAEAAYDKVQQEPTCPTCHSRICRNPRHQA